MEKRKRPPLPLDASPQEKFDNLILTFYENWQETPGVFVDFLNIFSTRDPRYYGFESHDEFLLFVDTLVDDGLLMDQRGGKGRVRHDKYDVWLQLKISYKGLNYCRSLLESGKNSIRCFVAMKYSDDMIQFYDEGIAKAIEENGFRPIRVDREHTENEQTINDFIIAGIKQSRFCVADLTHQSYGAYFEAGYALGRGLPVIYTCREDHFDEVHFDLKNMQIIKYSTPEGLREALSLKIQAKISE